MSKLSVNNLKATEENTKTQKKKNTNKNKYKYKYKYKYKQTIHEKELNVART